MKALTQTLALIAGLSLAPSVWAQTQGAQDVQAEVIYVGPDRIPSTAGTPDDQLEIQVKMTNVSQQAVRRSEGRVEVMEGTNVLRGYNLRTDAIPAGQFVLVSVRHRLPAPLLGTEGVTADIARRFGARAFVTRVDLDSSSSPAPASELEAEEEPPSRWRMR